MDLIEDILRQTETSRVQKHSRLQLTVLLLLSGLLAKQEILRNLTTVPLSVISSCWAVAFIT